MLTAKENLRQTIIDGGKPDRFVNNYEGIYLMMHPQIIHSGALLSEGDMNVVNAWGVTNSWPVGTPGSFPVHTPDKLVVKDIEDWKESVKAPSTDFAEAEWEEFQKQYEGVTASGKAYAAPLIVAGLFEQNGRYKLVTFMAERLDAKDTPQSHIKHLPARHRHKQPSKAHRRIKLSYDSYRPFSMARAILPSDAASSLSASGASTFSSSITMAVLQEKPH